MRSRRWIFWVVLVVSFLASLSAASIYLLLRGLDLAPPSVTAGSTLVVEASGDLPEDSLFDWSGRLFGFGGFGRVTVKDVLDSVERAKRDSRVSSLLLHIRGADFGWAKAEEIRGALTDFKASGKKLVAYVEVGGSLDYFLASAADSVYLHPQGILDIRGLAAEVTFMKRTLDKLGIEAEFEQVGRYKNAPDMFTRDSLSDAHREALEAIVEDLYQRMVDSIAEARKLRPQAVRAALDRGPFRAKEAKELGLVDALLYQDEVETSLVREGAPFQPLTVSGFRRARRGAFGLPGRPRIALVYGVGAIVSGESEEDPFFGRLMGSETLAETFKKVREDDSIKAVVFRIDSPGGSDIASDVIWREAALTMEKKPLVVSMSDVAASGGYWIATASHAIVAEPSTLTGSIGIYGGKFNLRGFYEKIGLNKQYVARGESADFWSDSRSFSEEERARFRRMLETAYQRFVEKVARARGKKPEEVDALGQGRVWTGAQARERGLVDELGGLARAVALARARARIPEEAEIEFAVYPQRRSPLELLWQRVARGVPELRSLDSIMSERLLGHSAFLRLLSRERSLALMPYRLRIH